MDVLSYIDSRTANGGLKHSVPYKNIYLLTIVLTIAQRLLSLNWHIFINWMPIDIRGNELADRSATQQGVGHSSNPRVHKVQRGSYRAGHSYSLQILIMPLGFPVAVGRLLAIMSP